MLFNRTLVTILMLCFVIILLVCHENIAFVPRQHLAMGPLPVFPGAEGFGSYTLAGRGGKLIRVSNLNDRGDGSFRAAAEASGPRIVVFEVGGSIDLTSKIDVKNPYLTIAGQTAPEPGVQLKNYGIKLDTHDVLVQHLRVRVDGGERDGVSITSSINEVYNIVVDHVTVNWASDENMEIWGAAGGKRVHDITVSNCLLAESRYGMVIGTDVTESDWLYKISVIDNAFAHNAERQPVIGDNSNVFLANNLSYNVKREFTAIVGSKGPKNATFIGNHYIGGPSGRGSSALGLNNNATPGNYYVDDCLVTGRNVGSLYDRGINSYRVAIPPIHDPTVSISGVDHVRDNVLRNAGARPAFRDSVEERIINEIMTETGSVRSSAPENGEWPVEYNSPSYRVFDAGPNPTGDDDRDGYTNVEEIIHRMAAKVEGR